MSQGGGSNDYHGAAPLSPAPRIIEITFELNKITQQKSYIECILLSASESFRAPLSADTSQPACRGSAPSSLALLAKQVWLLFESPQLSMRRLRNSLASRRSKSRHSSCPASPVSRARLWKWIDGRGRMTNMQTTLTKCCGQRRFAGLLHRLLLYFHVLLQTSRQSHF